MSVNFRGRPKKTSCYFWAIFGHFPLVMLFHAYFIIAGHANRKICMTSLMDGPLARRLNLVHVQHEGNVGGGAL